MILQFRFEIKITLIVFNVMSFCTLEKKQGTDIYIQNMSDLENLYDIKLHSYSVG